MLLTSHEWRFRAAEGPVEPAVAEHGEQVVHVSAGQGDGGLGAAFAFDACAVVEGPAGVVVLDGAAHRMAEDASEGAVSTGGAEAAAHMSRLGEYRRHARGRRQGVIVVEPVDSAADRDEFAGRVGDSCQAGMDARRLTRAGDGRGAVGDDVASANTLTMSNPSLRITHRLWTTAASTALSEEIPA